MNLGKKIIKIRKDNKMSQEEFAEKLNVSRQTVSNWENSKNYPDIETIIVISNNFDISLDILLKDDEEIVKEFDKKIKKGKKFNVTMASIVLVFLGLFFLYLAINNRLNNLPSVGVVCTYEEDFIEYHFEYLNKKTKKPTGGGGGQTDFNSEIMDEVVQKVFKLDIKSYDDVYELNEYIKSLFEEAGATCKIYSFKNNSDANFQTNILYDDFKFPGEDDSTTLDEPISD